MVYKKNYSSEEYPAKEYFQILAMISQKVQLCSLLFAGSNFYRKLFPSFKVDMLID